MTDDVKQTRSDVKQTRSDVKQTRSIVNLLQQDNGTFVEESIRSSAGLKFGMVTVSRFLLRSIHDVSVFSSPHEAPQEQIRELTAMLEKYAQVCVCVVV